MITAFIHTHAAKIMKILSDFIAVILFFVAYQITGNMITATTVAVVTGVIQAVYTFAVHKKIGADAMAQPDFGGGVRRANHLAERPQFHHAEKNHPAVDHGLLPSA